MDFILRSKCKNQRAGLLKSLVCAVAVVCSFSGCSHLIIRPDDSAAAKVAKFTTRGVLVFPTLSVSEAFMAVAKANDAVRIRNARCGEAVASWMGASYDMLRLGYGEPTNVSRDTSGSGFTAHYIYEVTYSTPGTWTSTDTLYGTTGTLTPARTHSYEITRSFHVSKHGTVDAYAWRGARDAEPANPSETRRLDPVDS